VGGRRVWLLEKTSGKLDAAGATNVFRRVDEHLSVVIGICVVVA
jgi:hypothetical protein